MKKIYSLLLLLLVLVGLTGCVKSSDNNKDSVIVSDEKDEIKYVGLYTFDQTKNRNSIKIDEKEQFVFVIVDVDSSSTSVEMKNNDLSLIINGNKYEPYYDKYSNNTNIMMIVANMLDYKLLPNKYESDEIEIENGYVRSIVPFLVNYQDIDENKTNIEFKYKFNLDRANHYGIDGNIILKNKAIKTIDYLDQLIEAEDDANAKHMAVILKWKSYLMYNNMWNTEKSSLNSRELKDYINQLENIFSENDEDNYSINVNVYNRGDYFYVFEDVMETQNLYKGFKYESIEKYYPGVKKELELLNRYANEFATS